MKKSCQWAFTFYGKTIQDRNKNHKGASKVGNIVSYYKNTRLKAQLNMNAMQVT